MDKHFITTSFQDLQSEICTGLEQLDGSKFSSDRWERAEGGGGLTRIIEGDHIEKGGVNFSAVHGPLNTHMAKTLGVEGDQFYATGVSIVLHPSNPMMPIIHMNVRFFEVSADTWWFGGGIDLTPHYVVPSQAKRFHQRLKDCCDQFDPNYYPDFKTWADNYFFIPHRNETRGVGGIFFDRLGYKRKLDKEAAFDFTIALGRTFVPIYAELASDNFHKTFDESHKSWQLTRRGRYVEFNLVYDRGTKFGLQSNGRTESILMSLPKIATWTYDYKVEAGSPEAETLNYLQKDIDWINHKAL